MKYTRTKIVNLNPTEKFAVEEILVWPDVRLSRQMSGLRVRGKEEDMHERNEPLVQIVDPNGVSYCVW